MAIDILEAAESGELISLTQLAHKLGKSRSTVTRWAIEGVRGAKLETAFAGQERVTTREAFRRFQESQHRGDYSPLPPVHMSAARRRENERIERELAADGF